MSTPETRTARCLCGAVTIRGTLPRPEVSACHCQMCRRWASGPFFSVSFDNAVLDGQDRIERFRSSDWAERGFCGTCGSNLFYHILGSDEYKIAAGLLDDASDLVLTVQFFIDKKPDHYTLAEKTRTLTGSEVFAAYAPPPG